MIRNLPVGRFGGYEYDYAGIDDMNSAGIDQRSRAAQMANTRAQRQGWKVTKHESQAVVPRQLKVLDSDGAQDDDARLMADQDLAHIKQPSSSCN